MINYIPIEEPSIREVYINVLMFLALRRLDGDDAYYLPEEAQSHETGKILDLIFPTPVGHQLSYYGLTNHELRVEGNAIGWFAFRILGFGLKVLVEEEGKGDILLSNEVRRSRYHRLVAEETRGEPPPPISKKKAKLQVGDAVYHGDAKIRVSDKAIASKKDIRIRIRKLTESANGRKEPLKIDILGEVNVSVQHLGGDNYEYILTRVSDSSELGRVKSTKDVYGILYNTVQLPE